MSEDWTEWHHGPREHAAECGREPNRCPNCLEVVNGEHWWEVPESHQCPPEAIEALLRSIGIIE